MTKVSDKAPTAFHFHDMNNEMFSVSKRGSYVL